MWSGEGLVKRVCYCILSCSLIHDNHFIAELAQHRVGLAGIKQSWLWTSGCIAGSLWSHANIKTTCTLLSVGHLGRVDDAAHHDLRHHTTASAASATKLLLLYRR